MYWFTVEVLKPQFIICIFEIFCSKNTVSQKRKIKISTQDYRQERPRFHLSRSLLFLSISFHILRKVGIQTSKQNVPSAVPASAAIPWIWVEFEFDGISFFNS